jgi:hypothetical protein
MGWPAKGPHCLLPLVVSMLLQAAVGPHVSNLFSSICRKCHQFRLQCSPAAQVMLLQPGAWLGAFLHSAAGELGLPASKASTEVLHSLLLPGAHPA